MDAHEIYLAGGCFWGTEAYLKKLPGIIDTEVGYVNANIENPSYEDVCTGATNAAEAVKVTYDADVISPSLLLQAYLLMKRSDKRPGCCSRSSFASNMSVSNSSTFCGFT